MISFMLLAMGVAAAQPIGDPRSWISAEDYPASAIAADSEGSVGVVLSIDPTGRVTDCVVDVRSGSADLDALTCNLLRDRARFLPTQEVAGRSTSSQFHQQVRWAISRDKLITQGFRITYSLGVAGNVEGCKIDKFGAPDADLTCSNQMIESVSKAYLTKPLTAYSKVAILLAMQVDDDVKLAVLRPESGERKVVTQSKIRVSPAGIILQCVTDQVAQIGGQSLDLCREAAKVGQKEFDVDATGRERLVTVSFEVVGVTR